MPNTDVCVQVLRTIESHGGRGFGNTGECIEVKTNKPLNNVMDTLNGGQWVLTASKENEMKSIYLKSVLAFIFVGVMAMIVCIPFYIVYLAQQPATPEQLTEILQETPCAAEAFQETLNYQSEPLTLGKANKIASECRKRNEMAEVKRVRENERNKIREKQIQALNDAHSVKER